MIDADFVADASGSSPFAMRSAQADAVHPKKYALHGCGSGDAATAS
jgi:hypothetical protein